MKSFLATTAIALVLANGAIAESHVAADSAATDSTMSTDSNTATDGTMTTTDSIAPADGAASTDGTMTTEDPAATDSMADTTATEMTDQTATDATSTTAEMAGSSDMSGAPAMTMDGYETLTNMDITADELTGMNVYGPDDEQVGEIGNLVIADDATITDVIVDVGGFLGLGEKPVSISFDSVQILKQTDGDDMRAYVAMTEDQMKELPKYEAPAEAMENTAPADGTMTDTPAEEAPATEAPAN